MKPKSKYLKIGFLNVGSLKTQQDVFVAAMEQFGADLIAINETWLRKGEDSLAPVIPGYRFQHIPRSMDVKGGRGGGVGFYIKTSMNARLTVHPSSSIEQIWVQTSINGIKLVVGTAYRPPWLDTDIFLDALVTSVTSFSYFDKIVLLGDFNINIMTPNDGKSLKFTNFLRCCNLKQIVDKPTHFTEHSQTLIDMICTDVAVTNLTINNISGYAHACLIAEFKLIKENYTPHWVTFRPIKDIDMDRFNASLLSIDWSALGSLSNVNDILTIFNSLVLDLFSYYAPEKKIYIKNAPLPWLTDNIKLMMRLRDQALSKFRRFKLDRYKKYYKDLKALVDTSLQSEKQAYFNFYINDNIKNPKKLWRGLRDTVVRKNNDDTPILSFCKDPDLINNHFLNIPSSGEVTISQLTYFEYHRFSEATFKLKSVTETEVAKIILNISSKASGSDGVSGDMILLTLPATLKIITIIINRSIADSKFPDAWKTSIIKPIPKVSTPTSINDLRPISILPFLSKILEKVVHLQLSNYLEVNNILPCYQSGFRKGRSTSTALLNVTDDILAAEDAGMGTILTLLDFSRAFDSINIKLLLSKLAFYGLERQAILWFSSFLNYRFQEVHLKKPDGSFSVSSRQLVERGVPQGSILGPLLFILYSADVINSITASRYHIYADDLQIYISTPPNNIQTAISVLNKDLQNISNWSMFNSLILNPSKSKFMILGSKKQIHIMESQNPKVILNDMAINQVSYMRNLGLLFDQRLRFEKHIVNVASQCFYRLKLLYKVRRYISTKLRLQLCETLILSKLNYGDVVFGPCLLSKSDRIIQRVQNACARFTYNIPRRSHVTPFINKSNSLKMPTRQKFHLACLLFDVIEARAPLYLYEKILWASRDTRTSKPILEIPPHRTTAFRGSFRYQATKCWNNIPPPIRNSRSKSSFKQKFRQFLFQSQVVP